MSLPKIISFVLTSLISHVTIMIHIWETYQTISVEDPCMKKIWRIAGNGVIRKALGTAVIYALLSVKYERRIICKKML